MNRLILAAPLVAALACSPAPHPAPVAPPAPPPPMAPRAPVIAPLDPLAAEAVLDKLHMLDGELIDASKLAEKSAHTGKVRKLAGEVVSARKKADAELMTLAAKMSVSLKDATQLPLPPDDKAMVSARRDQLGAMAVDKGPGFDGRYLQSVDDALKGELDLLSKVDAKPASPELKAYAAKLEPVVSEHEKIAAKELGSIDRKKAG